MRASNYCILFIFFSFFNSTIFAANIIWTGAGGDFTWGNPSNWDCNCLPGEGDDVTIGDGVNFEYVNFGEFGVTINSLTLQNAELDLQLDLRVLDFSDIDGLSTLTFAYYSSSINSVLETDYLYFYGSVNVYYNNVPTEFSSVEVFSYSEVETDCDLVYAELGLGDGFTVQQYLYCEEIDDGYDPVYYSLGPIEIDFIEYDPGTKAWDGDAGDNLWHNPMNWNDNLIPSANDIVVLPESSEIAAMQKVLAERIFIGANVVFEINDGLESELFTWVDESAQVIWKGGDLSRSNVSQQNIIFNYGSFLVETSANKSISNGLALSIYGPYGTLDIDENVVITTDGNNNALRNIGGIVSLFGDNQNIYFDEILNYNLLQKSSGSGESKVRAAQGSFINYDNIKSSAGTLILGDNFDNQGRLSGTASFDFEFSNGSSEELSGSVTPGNSPGALTFNSGPQLSSSTFVIELQGTNPGTQYDQLIVLADINIDGGVLNVQKPSFYNPQNGDQYRIIVSSGNITGTFNTVVFPDDNPDWGLVYNSNNITVTFGQVLPVELLSFSASAEEEGNFLVWSTASEINSESFVIEVKNESTLDWFPVGFVKSKGTPTQGAAYHFLHRMVDDGTNFYRLKILDLDGSFEYSKLISLKRNIEQQKFKLYPNPSSSFVNVMNYDQIQEILIFNSVGQLLKKHTNIGEKLELSDLHSGIYNFYLIDESGKQYVQELVVE